MRLSTEKNIWRVWRASWNLEIEYEGYEKKTLQANLKTSLNVGTIWL